MLLASFAVAVITLVLASTPAPALWALVVAIAAVILEIFSPWGTDNLTVPLGTALLLYFIL